MKTNFFSRIIISILYMLITCSSFSQLTVSRREPTKSASFPKTQNSNSTDFVTKASITVNDKVQKSFEQYFAGVSNQDWSMMGKDFHTTFYNNGVLTQALFDKKGNLINTISYGTEKDIPVSVKKIIKSEYYDYAITVAVKIKMNQEDIWVVNMKNDTEYLIVRVENGEMEQINRFNKSK